jgi:hypothetical protein
MPAPHAGSCARLHVDVLERRALGAEATDADRDDRHTYRWTIDGKPDGTNAPQLNVKVASNHTVGMTVSDGTDDVEAVWRIAALAPPPLPLSLALAALNQSAQEAAAPAFLGVLARMLGPGPTDSAVAVPRRPLTAVYADPASEYIRAHGGEIRVSSQARVRVNGDRVAAVEVRGERIEAETVIVAVPWFALADTFVGEVGALAGLLSEAGAVASSPIVTVNLWFDRGVLPAPFVGLPFGLVVGAVGAVYASGSVLGSGEPRYHPATSATRCVPDWVNTDRPRLPARTIAWFATIWSSAVTLRFDEPGRWTPAGCTVT